MSKITINNKAFTRTLEASSVSSQSERGFTLIELLVVIAIIGILAAIVLAALGGARTNAKEASILSSLNSARTQAEIYHISNNSYSGLCDDEKIQEIVASASSTGDGAACWEVAEESSYTGTYREELKMIDYGIAAELDNTYYVASPLGSGTVDSENRGSSDWSGAKTLCSNAGKRLPSPSALRAMYDIDGPVPLTEAGFTSSGYWTALDSSTNAALAYIVGLDSGSVSYGSKANITYVRCVD